ncbi:MAG TPA: hypothetical protein ENN09_03095 [Planctomycetes bacterium]|nr:hypothetical protein [Planctomycetota bacterium]
MLLSAFILASIILLAAAGIKKNVLFLWILSVLLWLASLSSAFFVGWAWFERTYSENWAMFGVYFLSAPVIALSALLALAALVIARAGNIENRKPVCFSLYALLFFLALQAALAVWAA